MKLFTAIRGKVSLPVSLLFFLLVSIASINLYGSLVVYGNNSEEVILSSDRAHVVREPLLIHENDRRNRLQKNETSHRRPPTEDETPLDHSDSHKAGTVHSNSSIKAMAAYKELTKELTGHTHKIFQKSRPPAPIELFETDNPYVRQRHQCIANARKQHFELLGPFFEGSTVDSVLLVDPAEHDNVGDSMLTLGEKVFLEHYGVSDPIKCRYFQAALSPSCRNLLFSTVYDEATDATPRRAMWHAGGNWGDLYGEIMPRRIKSFSQLLPRNFTVIGMPQSLHYGKDSNAVKDAETLRGYIEESIASLPQNQFEESQSRVILTWREHESYQRALELYPFVRNLMVPDIAFQLGPYATNRNHNVKTVDIVFFLRRDKESVVQSDNDKVQTVLTQTDGGRNFTFHLVDWKDRLKLFGSKDQFFTDTAIQLLSLGRVVVADRLHAVILSYLTGIPFVYIDQSTKKITKSLGVALNSTADCRDGEKGMWAKAGNLEDAVALAIEFLDKYNLYL